MAGIHGPSGTSADATRARAIHRAEDRYGSRENHQNGQRFLAGRRMSKEQPNDDLSRLQLLAEGIEAEGEQGDQAGPQSGQPGQAPGTSNSELLAGTFQLARDTASIITGLKCLRVELPDPTLEQLGQAWGAVADKRGWNLSAVMGDYGAEVAAVMMTLTIGMRLSKAVQAELDQDEEARTVTAPAATDATAS